MLTKSKSILFFPFCLTALFYNISFAQEQECTWVESRGSAYLANITPAQARAIAKRNAQAEAIAKVAGVEVKAETVVKNSYLQADLVKTMSEGMIVKEREIEPADWEEREDPQQPGNMLLTLHYKGCIRKVEGDRDPYFKVSLELSAHTFVEGDDAIFRAQCTKDCYLTLFNITADNKVLILFPVPKRAFLKNNFLKGGTTFEFPPKEARKAGVHYRVRVLKGQKKNVEIIEAVALKKRFDFAQALCRKESGRGFCEKGEGEVDLLDFLTVLSKIPLTERSEAVAVYLVRKR